MRARLDRFTICLPRSDLQSLDKAEASRAAFTSQDTLPSEYVPHVTLPYRFYAKYSYLPDRL